MIKILFVCHGNICRSPMAEYVFRDLVKKAGLEEHFFIASAATGTLTTGQPVYPPAHQKLLEHGICCAGKTARHLIKGDYDNFDRLIGMDSENMLNMERICGADKQKKMHLLLEYADISREVADPWYTGDFDAAWRDIERGCRGLLEDLTKKV